MGWPLTFSLTSKTKTTTQILMKLGIRSLCKIHSDHLFLLQIHFKVTENDQVSQRNRTHPQWSIVWREAAGWPCQHEPWQARGWTLGRRTAAGGPWRQQKGGGERGGDEGYIAMHCIALECCFTLDRAAYKDKADNTRLNITFSCNNEECDMRRVRQARSDVCAVQTRGEDLAPTYLTLFWNNISKLSINWDI